MGPGNKQRGPCFCASPAGTDRPLAQRSWARCKHAPGERRRGAKHLSPLPWGCEMETNALRPSSNRQEPHAAPRGHGLNVRAEFPA